jgi:MFS family permease
MLVFLSFFLISLGMTARSAGVLMGLTMAGVILFQVPVAWLADRLGKIPVLLGCYAVVLSGLCLLPFCAPSVWLAICLFLLGACSGAFYPLGLAILGENTPEGGLPHVFAWYMAMECFGSQLGAALMGKARDWWGEGAMFAIGFAAVSGVLLVSGILWISGRSRRQLSADRNSTDSGMKKAA